MLYKYLTIVKFLNMELAILTMKLPCEMAVWYILPVVRRDLAKELIRQGLSQRKISEIFGVSEAAISQYVKGTRGKGMLLGKKASSAVKDLAAEIAKKEMTQQKMAEKICNICMIAKKEESACKIHKDKFGAPSDCSMCLR
jgi:predicted transcriptional regulator